MIYNRINKLLPNIEELRNALVNKFDNFFVCTNTLYMYTYVHICIYMNAYVNVNIHIFHIPYERPYLYMSRIYIVRK